jgi:two-component system, NtrC family, response regulator AtoC
LNALGYRVLVHRKTGTTEHPLHDGGELVFGREPECTVSLSDGLVSRRHATLRLRGGALELTDLGSRNGSIVDSDRVPANAPVLVRPTSVIRIGASVIVLEEMRATSADPWCFDKATFDAKAAALLGAASRKGCAGVIEIVWATTSTQTTTTDATAPVGLQQALARIVGPTGLVGAHDGGRLVLLLPSIEEERLEASAALARTLCEVAPGAEVRVAKSRDARTADALLAGTVKQGAAGLIPPVVFQGGMRSVDALLVKLDASEAPVLILGETGVGKDVLARTLHGRSKRASRPFVALNCAAFTDTLFESELFGHERGAFTGAATAKTGLLESASGGTVFLDEIGEMPLGMQAKLLRVVENREVLRVGALVPRPIDVRFVFATNRDLRKEIEQKTFRADLFFRIGSISLAIPPLRARVDEIVPLSNHFIEVAAKRLGRAAPRLLPETARFLEVHAWPGNVRELKNVIELAVLVQDGDAIRPSDIHIERYAPADGAPSVRDVGTAPASESLNVPGGTLMTERERIVDALERSVGNQSNAAKLLGMPRRTLVKRLAQYDIPRPRKRES